MFHNFSDARFSKFNFSVILLKRVPVVSFKFFPCGVCANQNEQAAQRRWHCCDLSWWVILVPLSALPLNCTSVWGCNQTIANAHNEKVRWRGCDPHCGSTLMCACFLFSSTCLVVLTDTPLRPCWLKKKNLFNIWVQTLKVSIILSLLELYLRQNVGYSVRLHHWLFPVFAMKQERKSQMAQNFASITSSSRTNHSVIHVGAHQDKSSFSSSTDLLVQLWYIYIIH